MNVFPIKAGQKFPPMVKDWPNKAKSRAEWIGYEGANFGVHCAGMVVVDVDVRNGGLDSHEYLDMEQGWPVTYEVRTPTGGSHCYYSLPEGHPGVQNSASKLAPGIDIKSTGGYVLAAGSKVQAGVYEVVVDAPIAPAPEWLLAKLDTYVPREKPVQKDIPDAPADAVTRAKDWLATRPVGDEAYATACGLRDYGMSQAQALELLMAHDGRDVVEEKVAHAYEYAQNEAGSKLITFDAIEPEPAPTFDVLTFDQLADANRARPAYIVKGVLTKASHAMVYGPPGAGKTFNVIGLAHAVAKGEAWMGHKTRKGAVLYLAYEGLGGLSKRVRALRQEYGTCDIPLYFHAADFNLRDQAGRQALAQLIASLPHIPDLIIIDTLARAMAGGDENSAQDASLVNEAANALIQRTGACVLFVHHSGKNAENGARGSSAFLGALDTALCVDNNQIQATKQRDQELGAPIGFELHPVTLEEKDEDGEDITSCVVIQAPVKAKEDKLGKRAQRALDVLMTLPLMVSEADFKQACEAKYGKEIAKHSCSTEGIGVLIDREIVRREGDWIVRQQ